MNAIRKLQEAYDARLPDDDDDGDREYVTEQVGKLLNCEDGDCVPFHDRKERPFIGLSLRSTDSPDSSRSGLQRSTAKSAR